MHALQLCHDKCTSIILLLHGLAGSNQDMLLYAEFLANAGFGVFSIDLRAHGSSDGDTSTGGWREAEDVAGAVDYLLHRIDVNGQRIGALGISLGAQAALRGALKTDSLRALVLEGLGPVALGDHGGRQQSLVQWLSYPGNWLYYRLYHFMCGGRQDGVLEAIRQISARPILFIASGSQVSISNVSSSRLLFEPVSPESGDETLYLLQNASVFFNS